MWLNTRRHINRLDVISLLHTECLNIVKESRIGKYSLNAFNSMFLNESHKIRRNSNLNTVKLRSLKKRIKRMRYKMLTSANRRR